MAKRKDLFDKFMESADGGRIVVSELNPDDVQDRKTEPKEQAGRRRGQPRESDYISKTFRISKKYAYMLDEMSHRRRTTVKAILEEAMQLLDEKYLFSAGEELNRIDEERKRITEESRKTAYLKLNELDY